MTESSACDSRQYRFGYQLQAAPDVPGDFSLLPAPVKWLSAIFMPGDAEALWMPAKYPPRIYILTHDTLMVYSHPTAHETPFLVPLHDLIEVSMERALLRGSIRFHAGASSRSFHYNACHQDQMGEFLRALRSAWLAAHGVSLPTVSLLQPPQGIVVQCWSALRAELDSSEALLGLCSQPPIRTDKKCWLFRMTRVLPAVLLAVTNRRLIAISIGAGDTDDLYETVVRSAVAFNVEVSQVADEASGLMVSLKLKDERVWKFSFEAGHVSSVERFLGTLEHFTHSQKGLPPDASLRANISSL